MPARSRPDCPWCGASLAEAELLGGRRRCLSCGVATIDPWPAEAELDAAYAGSYRPASGRFAGIGDAVLRRTRAQLARRVDAIAPPGPVLDVGSGDGTVLLALRRRGREATGLERRDGETGVHAGEPGDLAAGAWAAVVFWHSLEHLPEPRRALEDAAGLLRADGVIIIATPNSASLQARAFGDRWFALDPPRHLVHFTAAALLAGLRASGMGVERVSYARGGQVLFGWLHGLVGLAPGHPDLYEAIRRPAARTSPLPPGRRAVALLLAVALLPVAALAASAELLARRGGTVYVEARCG